MAEPQTTTEPTLEPCPWCRSLPEQTDLAPSQRYRINHESTCWLVGRLVDLRGREGRSHFIALRDSDKWNSRVSVPNIAPVPVMPEGQWQHVQIKVGNPRVVAIQFETPEQASAFINSFAACIPEEYEAHRAMGHDDPAALRDEAALPPSVKTGIDGIARHIAAPIRECATAEQYAEVIRRATDLQVAAAQTLTRATTPASTAAAKIADQLIPHLDHAFLLERGWRDQIASIIERSLSSGS